MELPPCSDASNVASRGVSSPCLRTSVATSALVLKRGAQSTNQGLAESPRLALAVGKRVEAAYVEGEVFQRRTTEGNAWRSRRG